MRTISNSITGSVVYPALFCSVTIGTGSYHLWSGLGNKTITVPSGASRTYLGMGQFAKVSAIEETNEVKANGVTFELSGITPNFISEIIGQNYTNKPVQLYLGFLDQQENPLGSLATLFSGRLDSLQIEDNVDNVKVILTAESALTDLQRNKERRFTDTDQKINFPTDRGLEYMASAQSSNFAWGGKVNYSSVDGRYSGGRDVSVLH